MLYEFQVYNVVIIYLTFIHLMMCYHDKPNNYVTKLSYFWLYSLCCTLHLHDLFYNWKFVPLTSLHLFHPMSRLSLQTSGLLWPKVVSNWCQWWYPRLSVPLIHGLAPNKLPSVVNQMPRNLEMACFPCR